MVDPFGFSIGFENCLLCMWCCTDFVTGVRFWIGGDFLCDSDVCSYIEMLLCIGGCACYRFMLVSCFDCRFLCVYRLLRRYSCKIVVGFAMRVMLQVLG